MITWNRSGSGEAARGARPDCLTSDVEEELNGLHLLLSCLETTLDEALLCCHASDVVVEDEPG